MGASECSEEKKRKKNIIQPFFIPNDHYEPMPMARQEINAQRVRRAIPNPRQKFQGPAERSKLLHFLKNSTKAGSGRRRFTLSYHGIIQEEITPRP